MGQLQQADDGGLHLLPRQSTARQIPSQLRPQGRKLEAKRDHLVVFGFDALRAPKGMIAVLQSTLDVAASDLDVPIWRGVDPDVRPSWLNDQRLDPIQRGRVLRRRTIGIDIGKFGPVRLAPDARIKTVYLDKTGSTVGHTNLAIRRARLKGRAAA